MIQKILDEVITKEAQEERKETSGIGITAWRSSGLGTCMRGRFLSRLLSGTGIKPEIDTRTLRVFEMGNQIEEWLIKKLEKNQDYAVETQLEMYDPELNLSGHLDAFLALKEAKEGRHNEYIVECKSKHSKAFWYMDKKGEGAQIHHKMQLHSYLYMINKYGARKDYGSGGSYNLTPRNGNLTEGCILYVSKDDMAILEYPVRLEDKELEKMWKFDVETLNTCWNEKKAPPAPEKGSWQEKYCEFCKLGLCATLDDKKVKELFEIKDKEIEPVAEGVPITATKFLSTKKEFKIGDEVILLAGGWGDVIGNPVWGGSQGFVSGTIIEDRKLDPLRYSVMWDNGYRNSYHTKDLDYKPLS